MTAIPHCESEEAKIFVSSASIFWTFFRIGLFTLGGGLAMSPVMRHELVIRRRWVKDSDFIVLMSLATAVPGVIAVNIAYLLGRRMHGRIGSVAAILGTILPSFFVILLIAWILLPFFYYPKVAAFLHGCAIAVAGQLAFAGYIFGRKLLKRWQHIVVCAVGVVVVGGFRLHPIWGIISASILGFWLCPGDKA